MVHAKAAWQRTLFLLRGGRRLQGWEDEQEARRFHVLLTLFLVWIGVMGLLVVPLFVARKAVVGGILSVLGGTGVAGLVLLRRGRKRAAAALFLGALWCAPASISLFNGGVRSPLLSANFVLILVAGWLLGRSAAFSVAAATLLLSSIEALLERTGHALPVYFPGPPSAIWAIQVGLVLLVIGPILDVLAAMRKQVSALRESEERYSRIARCVPDVIWSMDLAGRFTYVNSAVERQKGWTVEEFLKLTYRDVSTPRQVEKYTVELEEAIEDAAAPQYDHNTVRTFESEQLRKDGSTFWAEVACSLLWSEDGRPIGIIGTTRDITERKRAEEEKARLEAQFHQAQKMETVGRLAGGVAHDFNNLLTVINGHCQILLARLSPGDPMWDTLGEIHSAGERAAGLTRQLLAFGRKQVLQPRVLDLDRIVEGMRPMLGRLLGEAIEVHVALGAGNRTVRADAHHLEQVLMNLVVNARDAMPRGGKLSIQTACVERNESCSRAHPEARPGRYVMLAVSDTGVGMDEETRRRIFEPFFTTKEAGKGTGLGLSTVQGLVAQSDGHIDVDSEPGHGTTFRIYLPALDEAADDVGRPAAVSAQGGNETVLVVEDQGQVRRYVVAVLREYGYRVMAAESASEALQLCERERGQIHLVLTDVVMPNVSGRELAEHLEELRPGIKVLFMSGYSDDVIVHHGVLRQGAEFIQKPFRPGELARKVRAVLGPPPC